MIIDDFNFFFVRNLTNIGTTVKSFPGSPTNDLFMIALFNKMCLCFLTTFHVTIPGG